MSVGSRIKERREFLKLTQGELAEKIGVTKAAVSNYENEVSTPKIELMYKIFEALKCDANYLHQDEMADIHIEKDPIFEEIHKYYNQLNKAGRCSLLQQARLLVDSGHYKKESEEAEQQYTA